MQPERFALLTVEIVFISHFWQEEEILDLLEQCEADENVTFDTKSGNRPISKGPKVGACIVILCGNILIRFSTLYIHARYRG